MFFSSGRDIMENHDTHSKVEDAARVLILICRHGGKHKHSTCWLGLSSRLYVRPAPQDAPTISSSPMMSGESAGCQELSSPAGRFTFLLFLFSKVSVLV